jgi:CRISPR-associated protein Csb1
MKEITLELLAKAISQNDSALRLRLKLEPVGGAGDKVFPPTYEGSSYAVEERLTDGRPVKAVLLNSVQSEAARLEQALKRALERDDVYFPTIRLELDGHPSLTELDLPHRVFDGYLVNSKLGKEAFWDSSAGKEIHSYRQPEATGLFRHSPATLLFGGWDTHSLKDKTLAHKFRFPRAIVSEIVAYDITEMGKRPASKGDPLNLTGTAYESTGGGWTPSQEHAKREDGKPDGAPLKYGEKDTKGQLSSLGLGQITPYLQNKEGTPNPGGYCAREISQTAVLSLSALRRLRFPLKPGAANDEKLNDAGRAVLAALGVYALSAACAEGYWLRSRCELVAASPVELETVKADGSMEKTPLPEPAQAAKMLEAAAKAAQKLGLTWRTETIIAKPNAEFAELIRQQGVV